jgi:heme oxygenase
MVPGCQPLRALKDQTRDLHLAAERYVHILEPDATLDDYARYLSSMLGFHAPIEDLFASDAALEAAGFAAASRRKCQLLERDLANRASPPHRAVAHFPRVSLSHAASASRM